jgi:hypothetical protein
MDENKIPEKQIQLDKRYCSWLLRMWQEHEAAPWRIKLQNVTSKEQHLFENLPTLLDFLAQQMYIDDEESSP